MWRRLRIAGAPTGSQADAAARLIERRGAALADPWLLGPITEAYGAAAGCRLVEGLAPARPRRRGPRSDGPLVAFLGCLTSGCEWPALDAALAASMLKLDMTGIAQTEIASAQTHGGKAARDRVIVRLWRASTVVRRANASYKWPDDLNPTSVKASAPGDCGARCVGHVCMRRRGHHGPHLACEVFAVDPPRRWRVRWSRWDRPAKPKRRGRPPARNM